MEVPFQPPHRVDDKLALRSVLPKGGRNGTEVAPTGCPYVVEDYDGAAMAIRRSFALIAEPGQGIRRDHATQSTSCPRDPSTTAIFASAKVAAAAAVLGVNLRCRLFALAV
jgi:hypothetical protein